MVAGAVPYENFLMTEFTFQMGFTVPVITRARCLQEWSQRELRLYMIFVVKVLAHYEVPQVCPNLQSPVSERGCILEYMQRAILQHSSLHFLIKTHLSSSSNMVPLL